MPRMKDFNSLNIDEQIERWEKAIEVLQGLPAHVKRKHWDMGDWGTNTECGTMACAAGHLGMDSWFRKRGLSLTNPFGRKLELCGEGACATAAYDQRVIKFFGDTGTQSIFFNGAPRNLTRVIREMKLYLDVLKADKAATEAEATAAAAAEAHEVALSNFDYMRI